MSSVITEDQLPDDVTSAESFLARHQEHKAEIETRQRSVNDFCDAADKLVADGHSASADVIDKKRRLSTAWQALQSTWSEKGLDLEHSKEVQMFKRDADQLEAWLNARELDQESNDVGDSLDAVEELLKKHDEFEKMLLAQEMKLLGISKLTNQEEELSKQRKDAKDEEEARRREEELRRKQEQERQEMEQRRKKEEDERQAKKEQELTERNRLEQIKLNEEKERKEKERKELNEREKLRALEERKRAEEMAKREEERKREEIVKVKQEEQRPHEWNYNDNAQGKKKASNTVTIEGILQRKQELASSGRKVHARAWKTLYTVLRGNELSFYREKKDSRGTNYAAPTLALTDGFCEEASDAVRRKNAFRLLCDDDSEFFFVAKDSEDLNRWITNINESIENIKVDLPSPLPPPQESPAALPLPEHQRSIGSPEETKPYERTPSPSITITSFDDDEDILVDPPPPPLVTAPPYPTPVEFPQDSMLTETEGGDLNEILADIGSIPLEPDSLPPAFPPPDFADFHDSLDGEDIPVLPASPPPDLNSDDEDSLDNGVEDSPLANILSELQRPTPPLRTKKKTSPSPVASTPESHRTYNSGGFSKPPIKPKPANLANQRSALRQTPDLPLTLKSADGTSESAHDLKKQDKRKGVLGNIFKKKK